ncbi:MAG: YggT family protein [Rhizobiales bacterium]|nr:YggT family protein [Hyphomicrobiales bacterium]
MHAILELILTVLWLYTIVIFAMVIMSWLIAFNVVNLHNKFVAQLWYIINRLTEPLLGPIRRFLPNMGGIDLSPIVLLLLVYFLQTLIARDIAPRLLGG